jgi:hypothetical protein
MPHPRPGQIWFLEEPRLGDATHGHYVLVTQVLTAQGKVTINFIATAPTTNQDYRISAEAQEFAVSGLKHTCHLLRDHAYDISIRQLVSKGEYRGFLSGELKKEIEEWWGEPF